MADTIININSGRKEYASDFLPEDQKAQYNKWKEEQAKNEYAQVSEVYPVIEGAGAEFGQGEVAGDFVSPKESLKGGAIQGGLGLAFTSGMNFITNSASKIAQGIVGAGYLGAETTRQLVMAVEGKRPFPDDLAGSYVVNKSLDHMQEATGDSGHKYLDMIVNALESATRETGKVGKQFRGAGEVLTSGEIPTVTGEGEVKTTGKPITEGYDPRKLEQATDILLARGPSLTRDLLNFRGISLLGAAHLGLYEGVASLDKGLKEAGTSFLFGLLKQPMFKFFGSLPPAERMLLYPTTETAYKLAKGVVTGEPAPGAGPLAAEFAMGVAAFAGGGKGRPMGEVAREMYRPVRESAKRVSETGKAVVSKVAAEAYGKARLDAMEAKAWAARVMKTVTETVGEKNIEGVRINPDGFLFKLKNNIDLQISGKATIGIGRESLIDTALPAATSGFEGAAKFSYHIVPEGVNARIELLWDAPADKLRHDIGHLLDIVHNNKKDWGSTVRNNLDFTLDKAMEHLAAHTGMPIAGNKVVLKGSDVSGPEFVFDHDGARALAEKVSRDEPLTRNEQLAFWALNEGAKDLFGYSYDGVGSNIPPIVERVGNFARSLYNLQATLLGLPAVSPYGPSPTQKMFADQSGRRTLAQQMPEMFQEDTAYFAARKRGKKQNYGVVNTEAERRLRSTPEISVRGEAQIEAMKRVMGTTNEHPEAQFIGRDGVMYKRIGEESHAHHAYRIMREIDGPDPSRRSIYEIPQEEWDAMPVEQQAALTEAERSRATDYDLFAERGRALNDLLTESHVARVRFLPEGSYMESRYPLTPNQIRVMRDWVNMGNKADFFIDAENSRQALRAIGGKWYAIRRIAPPIESAMSKAINSTKWPQSVKPEILKNELKKAGVKDEEMYWAHLDELVAKHQKAGTKISAAELKQWIATNDTKIYFRQLSSADQFNRFIVPKVQELERDILDIYESLVAAGQPPKFAMAATLKMVPPPEWMLYGSTVGGQRPAPGYPRNPRGSAEGGTFDYTPEQTMGTLRKKMQDIGYSPMDSAVRSISLGLTEDPATKMVAGVPAEMEPKVQAAVQKQGIIDSILARGPVEGTQYEGYVGGYGDETSEGYLNARFTMYGEHLMYREHPDNANIRWWGSAEGAMSDFKKDWPEIPWERAGIGFEPLTVDEAASMVSMAPADFEQQPEMRRRGAGIAQTIESRMGGKFGHWATSAGGRTSRVAQYWVPNEAFKKFLDKHSELTGALFGDWVGFVELKDGRTYPMFDDGTNLTSPYSFEGSGQSHFRSAGKGMMGWYRGGLMSGPGGAFGKYWLVDEVQGDLGQHIETAGGMRTMDMFPRYAEVPAGTKMETFPARVWKRKMEMKEPILSYLRKRHDFTPMEFKDGNWVESTEGPKKRGLLTAIDSLFEYVDKRMGAHGYGTAEYNKWRERKGHLDRLYNVLSKETEKWTTVEDEEVFTNVPEGAHPLDSEYQQLANPELNKVVDFPSFYEWYKGLRSDNWFKRAIKLAEPDETLTKRESFWNLNTEGVQVGKPRTPGTTQGGWEVGPFLHETKEDAADSIKLATKMQAAKEIYAPRSGSYEPETPLIRQKLSKRYREAPINVLMDALKIPEMNIEESWRNHIWMEALRNAAEAGAEKFLWAPGIIHYRRWGSDNWAWEPVSATPKKQYKYGILDNLGIQFRPNGEVLNWGKEASYRWAGPDLTPERMEEVASGMPENLPNTKQAIINMANKMRNGASFADVMTEKQNDGSGTPWKLFQHAFPETYNQTGGRDAFNRLFNRSRYLYRWTKDQSGDAIFDPTFAPIPVPYEQAERIRTEMENQANSIGEQFRIRYTDPHSDSRREVTYRPEQNEDGTYSLRVYKRDWSQADTARGFHNYKDEAGELLPERYATESEAETAASTLPMLIQGQTPQAWNVVDFNDKPRDPRDDNEAYAQTRIENRTGRTVRNLQDAKRGYGSWGEKIWSRIQSNPNGGIYRNRWGGYKTNYDDRPVNFFNKTLARFGVKVESPSFDPFTGAGSEYRVITQMVSPSTSQDRAGKLTVDTYLAKFRDALMGQADRVNTALEEHPGGENGWRPLVEQFNIGNYAPLAEYLTSKGIDLSSVPPIPTIAPTLQMEPRWSVQVKDGENWTTMTKFQNMEDEIMAHNIAAQFNGGGRKIYTPIFAQSNNAWGIHAYSVQRESTNWYSEGGSTMWFPSKEAAMQKIEELTRPQEGGAKEPYRYGVYEIDLKSRPDLVNWLLYESRSKFAVRDTPPVSQKQATETELAEYADILGEKNVDKLAVDGKVLGVNLDKINSVDDVKKAIAATVELYTPQIDAKRRGVRSHEATMAAAKALGMKPDDLLNRATGEAYNAEQMVAAFNMAIASGRILRQTADAFLADPSNPKNIDRFSKALGLHRSLQAQYSGARAETGRSVEIQKVMQAGETTWLNQIGQVLMEGAAGEPAVIAKMIGTMKTPEQLGALVKNLERAKTTDILMEIWINGLLSGPQTHAANLLGNMVTMLMSPMERLAAGTFRGLTPGDARGVYAGEATQMLAGMYQGLSDAISIAAKNWPTEYDTQLQLGRQVTEDLGKLDYGRIGAISSEQLGLEGTTGKFVDILGKFVRTPGGILRTADQFFKLVNYRMELNALAYRAARNAGLSGKDATERMKDILSGSDMEVLNLLSASANKFADIQTFTNSLGQSGEALVMWANSSPWTRLVLPFIRTPINIFKYSLDRTPILNMLQKSMWNDLRAGGTARDLAVSKISTSAMVLSAAVGLALSGAISGAGPDDRKKQAMLKAKGWQPYSVKIGDRWVSYNRVEPIGAALGAAATFAEIWADVPEAELDTIVLAGALAFADAMVSKTYLQGISQVMDAIKNPDRSAERVMRSYLASTVPAIVGQTNRTMFDNNIRELWSLTDAVRSRIPGLSQNLPPKRDIFGHETYYPGGLGPDILSPIQSSEEKAYPAMDELLRHGVTIGLPPRWIFGSKPEGAFGSPMMEAARAGEGIELAPWEYDAYAEKAGRLAEKYVMALMKDSDYKGMTNGPDGGKAFMLRKAFYEARRQAQQEMLEKNPRVTKELEGAYQRRYERRTGEKIEFGGR